MKKYAILCYLSDKDNFDEIILLELGAILHSNDINIKNLRYENIAKIPYIVFECQEELTDNMLTSISRLSLFFAIFEMVGELLMPISAHPDYAFDLNIPSMLKYQGKTNERFTRLMINLAYAVSKSTTGERAPKLLDPVAGKCTTLYDGMMLGFDVYGIEIRNKYFVESSNFITKYMQKAKYKHKVKKEKISDKKAKKVAEAFSMEYARKKDDFYAGNVNTIKIINGDTSQVHDYIKKNSIDMMVGDLPYGVQHGSRSKDRNKAMSRNAVSILEDSIANWQRVLRKKGALVLSFNEFTTPKDDMVKVLENAGMTVLKENIYNNYQHMVDSSIKRDLVVAVKE